MAKRKEYLETADKAVRELTLAYYKEHGKLPDSYSVLKSALTRSYNNMRSEVMVLWSNIKNKPVNTPIILRPSNKY